LFIMHAVVQRTVRQRFVGGGFKNGDFACFEISVHKTSWQK